jgi:hypothetical protein
MCPQYPNCLKKLQKIMIDLNKEPLSNSGKNEKLANLLGKKYTMDDADYFWSS